ncbi:MAG: ABC transporter ATP-binding protein [Spirochaetes bacterium]|nr:ABC transporter ATP-binding protein [Spirochaetota bacterium]
MELKSSLELKDLSFGYTKRKILEDINFTISKGQIVTILGPNGCGKSTLIRLMLGFLKPDKGNVILDGKDLIYTTNKELACEIAYVPQIHKSAFPYSVIDVVLMGRIPHKSFFFKYSKGDLEIANDSLKRLSISHLADRPYTEISGGERQLTIIARALSQGARTFIMDEPAGGLDYGNQLRLLEEILKLSEAGYTFIKSTHSPEHALWIADRVIMIKNGSLFADGKSDEVVTSNNLKSLYRIEVKVEKVNGSIRVCVPQKLYQK